MLKDLLKKAIIGLYFNEKSLQIAYKKHDYMELGDHGYYKGMKAYHDFENDLCICRNFDNPYLSLRKKGFKEIVKDKGYFNLDYHIKESEVKRLLNVAQRPDKIAKLSGKTYIKEVKGKQSKFIVKGLDKQKEKQESLMKDLLVLINKLKEEKNKEKIAELVFDIGNILKKNLFTLEELKNYETIH